MFLGKPQPFISSHSSVESRTFSYFVLCSAVWLAAVEAVYLTPNYRLHISWLKHLLLVCLYIAPLLLVNKQPTKCWMLPTTKVQWSVVATGQHRYPHVSRLSAKGALLGPPDLRYKVGGEGGCEVMQLLPPAQPASFSKCIHTQLHPLHGLFWQYIICGAKTWSFIKVYDAIMTMLWWDNNIMMIW